VQTYRIFHHNQQDILFSFPLQRTVDLFHWHSLKIQGYLRKLWRNYPSIEISTSKLTKCGWYTTSKVIPIIVASIVNAPTLISFMNIKLETLVLYMKLIFYSGYSSGSQTSFSVDIRLAVTQQTHQ